MTQNDLYALLPFVLLALVFWFLVFRPARKRQRETQQTQASLEVGARVMLTSGIFGDVVSVGDASVEVDISEGTVVTVHRQAVGKVLSPDDPMLADADDADDAATEEPDEKADEDRDAAVTAADEPDRERADDASLPPTHQEKR